MQFLVPTIFVILAALVVMGVMPLATGLWIAVGVIGAVILVWVAIIGFLAWAATR